MARRTNQRKTFSLESLETREVLSSTSAVPVSVAAPTADLQYALELTNEIRTNPAAAVSRLTSNMSQSTQDTLRYYGVNVSSEAQVISNMSARQPLAWNTQLANAAQSHSEDMATKGYQSHTGSDGSSPSDRMASAGYNGSIRTAENAYAYGESIDQNLQAFLLDWGVSDKGHRRNLLEPDNGGADSFKEVGIGLVDATRPGFGKVMTQDFGVRANQPAQVVGVAYTDKNHDNAYSIGEGQGGVVVEAIAQDGTVAAVQTAGPGGYQIPLQPGKYQIKAFQGNKQVLNKTVQIGSQNIKVDMVLDGSSSASSSTTPVVATPRQATNTVTVARPNTVKIASPTVITNATKTTTAASAPTTIGFSWSSWKSIPRA